MEKTPEENATISQPNVVETGITLPTEAGPDYPKVKIEELDHSQEFFKWMAKKLKSYEEQAVGEIYEKEGIGLNYNKTDLFSRIEILSRYSKYAVLCAEESYGYLPLDIVRDKDGNASSLAICEALSYLKSQEVSPMEFLDQLYNKYGYHLEETKNIYLEGAKGSEQIKKIMSNAPNGMDSVVIGVDKSGCSGYAYKLDFGKSSDFKNFEIIDQDGAKVLIDPKATMFLLGSVMDYREDKLASRFVFDNPNEKSTCGCGESFSI